jgi:hypothetical protein
VRWLRQKRRWSADLRAHGREIHIASFADERTAAEAYDRLALHYLGPAAQLNFPEEPKAPASLAKLRREARSWKTSRFRGVFRSASRGQWDVQFRIPGGSSATITGYDTEQKAARAYDRAALHYFGPRARLNFPTSLAWLEPADIPTLVAEKRRQFKATTTSRFRGVSWDKRAGKWHSTIKVGGRPLFLGHFDDEQAAAVAYDDKAMETFGWNARPNFHPETGEELRGEKTLVSLQGVTKANGIASP